jgi:hypothetical protein
MSDHSSDCLIEFIDPISEYCNSFYNRKDEQSESIVKIYQAFTKKQYFENGSDPLDYINIYYVDNSRSNGDNYFHYVSLGFSDLYNDERVHKYR